MNDSLIICHYSIISVAFTFLQGFNFILFPFLLEPVQLALESPKIDKASV